MKRKWVVGGTLAAAAAAALVAFAPASSPVASNPTAGKASSASGASSPAAPAASGPLAALPQRAGLSRPRGDPFAPPVVAAPRPAAASRPAAVVEAAPPAPPPMPYRVAGQVVRDGRAEVVLARDDRVVIAHEGEALDGGYRVESIRADRVTLVYTPLDVRQSLPVVTALRAPERAAVAAAKGTEPQALAEGAARLRWEGPDKVQAGSTFDVALKITSPQPVRGSPLQLSYDASLLQPVSVRRGQFFADGTFTYRVNPAGSIFVGAAGRGAVPADAEFVVVTFRPVRAGATAELKLSAMALQGPGGAPLLHEPLAAFRTAIVQ